MQEASPLFQLQNGSIIGGQLHLHAAPLHAGQNGLCAHGIRQQVNGPGSLHRQLEFQLPVEASGAVDLLADTVGAQPVLTSMEWGRMKVQLPSNYATILQLE